MANTISNADQLFIKVTREALMEIHGIHRDDEELIDVRIMSHERPDYLGDLRINVDINIPADLPHNRLKERLPVNESETK